MMKRKLLFESFLSHTRARVFATMIATISALTVCSGQPASSLSFDGIDDKVDLPNILTSSYTKEAWIFAPLDNGAVFNNNIVSGTATAFWFPGTQAFQLSAGHSFPFTDVQDPVALVANTWYHVAVTYDAATTTMRLYKNGVQVSSNTAVAAASETILYVGAFLGANYMKGQIDEVRVWSTALTVGEIRDWMCKKVTSSHPQWANMLAYYKADENAGTTLTDSRNTNNGTLTGGTGWATSGAALGDASAHDYVNAIKTASITHPSSGESLSATSTSGSPDGIHVYRVDAAPTNTTGITGLGNNNKYFGVFQAGGTSPVYTAEYTYNQTGIPDETALRVFKRADNSASPWTNTSVSPNTTTNTITITGESTEYVLGSLGAPLPVLFTGFSVTKERNGVRLNWSTASETNNSGFMVQRSVSGGAWIDLEFVAGNGNSFGPSNYNYLDQRPAKGQNYYRLKQIDIDNNSKFSEVRVINYIDKGGVTIYPVPSSDRIVIDMSDESLLNKNANLINSAGAVVMQFRITKLQEQVSIANLKPGQYILQLPDGTSHKVVRQ
jgi:hypothetical protein